MSIEDLKRMPAFADLPAAAMTALAAEARRVRLPPRRWLVQPGRVLAGHYYLLDGRVRIVGDGAPVIVTAGTERAQSAVYPGAAGVETLSPSLFLKVNPEPPGWAPDAGELGVPEVRSDDDAWQRRFLMSPLLQRLEPPAWQRILRAMSRQTHDAGEQIVAAGQGADRCYVLCAGRAEVTTAAGLRLATLQPGSLFGEEALISGAVRNASVWMRSAGATVSLPAVHFDSLLLHAIVQPLGDAHGRRLISLDPEPPAAAIRMAVAEIRVAVRSLAPAQRYGVVGGSRRERALAAFLLVQLGIDAAPLA
jgi:CRP-like cAMP-binding protein